MKRTILLILIFMLSGCGSRDDRQTLKDFTINGMAVKWHESAEEAISEMDLVLQDEDNTLSCENNNIDLTLTGQSSGESFSTKNLTDDVKASVSKIFGGNPAISVTDTGFVINAKAFDDEIVLVTAELNNGSVVDQKFGKGIEEGYYAFKVPHIERENNELVDMVTSEESSDKEGVVQEIVDFWTEDFNIIEENVNDFLDEQEVIKKVPPKNGEIICNGFNLTMYETPSDALSNVTTLTSSTEVEFKAVVDSQNTSRVSVFVVDKNGTNAYQEYFLTEDNDWTATVDLSQYTGKKIIMGICTTDTAMIPKSVYKYIGVHISA